MNLYDTMYGRLPNLVIGFHGCDESTFEKVLNQKQMLHSSTNSYDWLGNGMYFWEQKNSKVLNIIRNSTKPLRYAEK